MVHGADLVHESGIDSEGAADAGAERGSAAPAAEAEVLLDGLEHARGRRLPGRAAGPRRVQKQARSLGQAALLQDLPRLQGKL